MRSPGLVPESDLLHHREEAQHRKQPQAQRGSGGLCRILVAILERPGQRSNVHGALTTITLR